MSAPDIDWKKIRPLRGSRHEGFEELCSQLATLERPLKSEFYKKGKQDAGVECFAVLEDGTEWGWQAKYFDKLEDSQWGQIDKSVKTALEKHPKLTRYYVCLPLDPPDARVQGRKSALDRWNEHVAQWEEWAKSDGLSVEFVLWGSFQLVNMLTEPINIGRLYFWFDVRLLDWEWFNRRLDDAIVSAGPRYTPEVHVELSIAQDLEAFGRSESVFDRIKQAARKLREKHRLASYEYLKDGGLKHESLSSDLDKLVEQVYQQYRETFHSPMGDAPFGSLLVSFDDLDAHIEKYVEQIDAETAKITSLKEDPETDKEQLKQLRRLRSGLSSFQYQASRISSEIRYANKLATKQCLLVTGAAGVGKSHLLCDIAKQRVGRKQPTVLLMGQRFLTMDNPWQQALGLMDFQDISTSQFVSILEVAAQTSNNRALLIVDAINEGGGRQLWEAHIQSFVNAVVQSPWIGVVFAIRSPYEKLILPESLQKSSVILNHDGFQGKEYDAVKAYFSYYNLELPGARLFNPEYKNPYFLKILCKGLHDSGHKRVPGGMHGITAILDMYIDSANKQISTILRYNPDSRNSVRSALNMLTEEMIEHDRSWVIQSRAEELLSKIDPTSSTTHSLYSTLVSEGILVETLALEKDKPPQEIVYIAYERLSDHLVVTKLLDENLSVDSPEESFAQDGALSWLLGKSNWVNTGRLESLFIQIPERTGKELPMCAPSLLEESLGAQYSFRQSIIWRDISAFTDDTRELINQTINSQQDFHEVLDIFLSVSTIPNHPFNANFLDSRLRQDEMPERDSWWIPFLHQSWDESSAVDRIIDWAYDVNDGKDIGAEPLMLCSIVLTWMLASSNRFLRDRATIALVNILSHRLDLCVELLEKFIDVDDPYILERAMAATYGVSQRSHDSVAITKLAQFVYRQFFESREPIAHILLRDYARGVVERARFLDPSICFDMDVVRPPYGSALPDIPSNEDIKHLLSDWSKKSPQDEREDWARDRIADSVMEDDFGRYVIGTNNIPHWLALKLDETRWKSTDQRLEVLLNGFEKDQLSLWEDVHSIISKINELSLKNTLSGLFDTDEDGDDSPEQATSIRRRIEELTEQLEKASARFEATLTDEEKEEYLDIAAHKWGDKSNGPPPIDLEDIQRYVLWRVHDLGWTSERFGTFDRFAIGYHGRSASKAERIGKKYQWIAYHEVLAYVADNHQYWGGFEGDVLYEGPWQEMLRDIDPSSTLRSTGGGTGWGHTPPAWWTGQTYNSWDPSIDHDAWISRIEDLPDVRTLILTTNPDSKEEWVNLHGLFRWGEQVPPEEEPTNVDRRELMYWCNAYVLRANDVDAFMNWAEGVDFWGRWMPDPAKLMSMHIGEYGWSPASKYFQKPFYGYSEWSKPGYECPVEVMEACSEYLNETGGFDCSIDESISLLLPSTHIVNEMDLRWSGMGADFRDESGNLVVYDPTAWSPGPTAILAKRVDFLAYCERHELAICWTMIGEKRILGAGWGPERHNSLRLSGAYTARDGRLQGFKKLTLDEYDNTARITRPKVLGVVRDP